MQRALIRFAAVATSCCLLAGGLALPADAATPVPPTNVITIPSPDQASDTADATLCPWRMAYAAVLTESASKTNGAASRPTSQAVVLPYAPLVTALCGMFGS
ncbi:hypothetical protein [Catenulispora pinisilvae]|uniref:hypothetical protein n=1 Tax=Catenulispora pinisilvae TaxID=2705253 RepID=UPI0018916D48|nr:hypothetical protein [Catenulispora pinisilvae]